MLIGRIEMTKSGIYVYDVDGSYDFIRAQDALTLAAWIAEHREELERIAESVKKLTAKGEEEQS